MWWLTWIHVTKGCRKENNYIIKQQNRTEKYFLSSFAFLPPHFISKEIKAQKVNERYIWVNVVNSESLECFKICTIGAFIFSDSWW